MLKFGFILAAISAASVGVHAQGVPFAATPLVSKHFPTPSDLPYKVDTDDTHPRGPQLGYNICNSTTENQQSLCQTFHMNNIGDFCLTAPPAPGKTVADQEGEMVAWCTKKGHGTRLIPQGAIKGVEVRKTPDYMQFVGLIDQTMINIPDGDYGGEMDSGGADGRGNPKGAAVYSNAWTGSSIQGVRWTCFMGSNSFGCKVCDPSRPNSEKNCEHIYDRIGIFHNMPHLAEENKFVSCEAPSAEFVGIYTQNGQVMTYTQPDEALGAINGMPYTPTIPPASQCTTYTSAELYKDGPTASGVTTARSTGTAKPSSTGTGSRSGTAASASNTSTGSTGGAASLSISAASLVLSIGVGALFLA